MEDIIGVWIFQEDGSELFSYIVNPEQSETGDTALFQGFILSIQRFVKELGEKQTHRIDMGKEKIFISKNEETSIIFVIRATKQANNKRISKLLEKIQNDFIKSFKPYLSTYSPDNLKQSIDDIFRKYLEKTLQRTIKRQFDGFLGNV